MMKSCDLEERRTVFKPANKIKILFIGEARPSNGTFFYCANSILFHATREALDKTWGVATEDGFQFLKTFSKQKCYLYDVFKSPISGDEYKDEKQRKKAKKALKDIIQENNPSQVIVIKKRSLQQLVREVLKDISYSGVASYLPFPMAFHKDGYVAGVIKALKDNR